VLEEARNLGFLGPGPLEPHVAHADGYQMAWEGPPPAAAVDLGSGGGLPGLPLALAWPTTVWLLVEGNGRRARFLAQAARRLGIDGRVQVRADRAEMLGRDVGERGRYQAVVARGFGPPAVTAECGAPFLAVGGRLLTSEPPDLRPWPPDPLDELGLVAEGRRGGVMVLRQSAPCPERFPRRAPAKRPLF
jgi:16S rRNA (guanine527-N7)-methyltransferase